MNRSLILHSPLANLFNFDVDFPTLKSSFEAMKADIVENEKEFQVITDLPGVNKDDIQVDFDNGVLSISVEAKNEKENKEGEKVWRMERSVSRKSRSFKFDTQIDDAEIGAKYENGVLTLTLPKKASEQKTKILIQ
jgi:HSP20 family protein